MRVLFWQAIEVRLGPQGVKAKYVRIELRKVETLPGGGQQNTFVDYVGQSPINLWQSSEEFSTLHAVSVCETFALLWSIECSGRDSAARHSFLYPNTRIHRTQPRAREGR